MHALGVCGLGSTPSSPKMKKDFCTLYLIRHGETEWNRDKIIMGHKDAPLTGVGVRQANDLAAILKSVNFSAVYTSDLPRAVRTAEIICGVHSLSIDRSTKLRERNFSRFEGMSATVYSEKNKTSLLTRNALPEQERWNFKIAGCVESDVALVTRVIAKLRQIASAHVGEKVLVSTHGGPIRFLLVKLGFAPYGSLPGGSFKNCGYIVVESDGVEFNIKKVHGIKKHEDIGK